MSRRVRHARAWTGAVALQALLMTACGGGGGGGTPGPLAPPPVGPVHAVSATVFYDENDDGRLGSDELVRLQGVAVRIGPSSARTTTGGNVTVGGVPEGRQQASLPADGLPPFYVPGAPQDIDVPQSAPLELPVTLPIAGNLANRYLAFGDSITAGEGSSGERGYVESLEDKLTVWLGKAELRRDGRGGTTSEQGEARLGQALGRNRPAYTLILYGTNDWYQCPDDDPLACFTVGALRGMVGQAEAAGSLPVVATLIPVNAGYDARVPPQRNEWVAGVNVAIRAMVSQEGALLADLEPAYYKAAGNDLSQLFDDHVHPNELGYDVISDVFFRALSEPRVAPVTTSRLSRLFSAARRPSLGHGPRTPRPRVPPSRY